MFDSRPQGYRRCLERRHNLPFFTTVIAGDVSLNLRNLGGFLPDMNVKTSSTHPIRIAKLPCGDRNNCIGITLCPGKKGPSTFGGRWERDLNIDLAAIKEDFDPKLIITLMTREELMLSKVSDIGSKVEELGIRWLHFPIEDMAIAGQKFEEMWRAERLYILRTLGHRTSPDDYFDVHNEGNILIHCRGGLGRSGMLATVILSELGLRNETALGYVRKIRPGAVETKYQEEYTREYIPSIKVKVPDLSIWPHCFYVMATTVKSVKDYLAGTLIEGQEPRFPFHIDGCPTDADPLVFLESATTRTGRYAVIQSMDNLVLDFECYMENIGEVMDKILKTLGISATKFPSTIESWVHWPNEVGSPGDEGFSWCFDVNQQLSRVFQNQLPLGKNDLLNIKKSFDKMFLVFEDWKLNIEGKEKDWNSWQANPNAIFYLDYLQTLIAHWDIRDLG